MAIALATILVVGFGAWKGSTDGGSSTTAADGRDRDADILATRGATGLDGSAVIPRPTQDRTSLDDEASAAGDDRDRTRGSSTTTNASSESTALVAGTQIDRSTSLPVQPMVGAPYGETVPGVLTFRGSPGRNFYGTGPMPTSGEVIWRFPASGGMCSNSRGGAQLGKNHFKCGTGWTGQPAVFDREGRTWVVFGAYDRKVHFLDAATGARILPDLETGDHIKGSGTVDPDGFPIFYIGSRDNKLRAIALDRDTPEVLWALDAHDGGPTRWNDDWDGAPLILDDHLIVGGENSRFQVVRLNRGYGDDGLVRLDPTLIIDEAGWDDRLLASIGDETVSIENSVTIVGSVAYFANSGGLVQGWDLSRLDEGSAERVFRFWLGDDVDATLVADDDGFLYAAGEYERGLARAREVGQIVKLDPTRPDDPVVWSVADHDRLGGGVWATPAIHGDLLYVGTDGGRLLAIDRQSGAIVWTLRMNRLWPSPVVVDDVLLQGDCDGILHAFDVSTPGAEPPELWSVDLGGCIESTPTVWRGRIYVGSRAGQLVAIG